MTITRVGLLARRSLPGAVAALAEAAAWLDGHGCVPVIERDSAAAAGLADRWPAVARDALAAQVDVIIAFGGDGTLLDAAGLVALAGLDVPILGVNLGRLGFLAEVSRTDVTQTLAALIGGATRTESRLMIEGRVERHGATVHRRIALNDLVITRSALSRMMELDVAVEGQLMCHVKADGVIVATATGSTAYNLSAGGPIVHPLVDALILTPIAPHALTNRPLVLPADKEITLRPVVEEEGGEVLLTFDGQFGVPLEPGDVVVAARARRPLRLIRTTSRTHFDVLREKLKWGHA